MLIKSIHAFNFRRIKEVDLAGLPPAVLIAGENDQGKTSMLDAVRFAFFGAAGVYDAAGKKVLTEDLIGAHADYAEVSLEIEAEAAEIEIKRRIGTSPRFDVVIAGEAVPGTADAKAAAMFNKLATTPAAAAAVTNPRALLSGGDFDSMLADFTGARKVDPADLMRYAGEAAEWLTGFICTTEPRLQGKPAAEVLGRANLEGVGKDAYAERTAANKIAAELTRQLEARGPAPENPVATNGAKIGIDSLPTVESRLETLRAKAQQIQGQLLAAGNLIDDGETEKEIAAHAEAVAAQRATIHGVRNELNTLEAAAPPDAPPQALIERAEAISRDLEAASAEMGRLKAKTEKNAADLIALEAESAALTASYADGKCACGFVLTKAQLKTAADNIAAKRAGIDTAINGIVGTLEKDRAKLADLSEGVSALETELGGISKEIAAARAAYDAANKGIQSRRASLRDTLLVAERDYEHLIKAHEAAQARLQRFAAAVDIDALKAEAAETAAAIERGAAIRAALIILKDRADLEARIEAQRILQSRLDWAVKAFYHGDYFAQRAEKLAAPFVDRLKAPLAAFGYAAHVQRVGKGIELLIGGMDAIAKPYRLSSKAVQTFAQIAVGMAFSSAGLALIDDVDGLDSKHRARLMDLLKAHKGGSLIVCGALGAAMEPIAPAALVWIENGKGRVIA